MWIVCRYCNSKFLLAKTYGIYGTFQEENLYKELNKFFNDHAFCDNNKNVSSENGFKICYDHSLDDGIDEI